MSIKKINPVFWLWLPVLWMGVQICIEAAFTRDVRYMIHSEYGPHEFLEFLLIGFAAVLAWRTLWNMDRNANRWLALWIGVAALACTYIAVEEMSWGQTIFRWHTPEFWREINGQRETNLHNTSDWLNKNPRTILEIGVLVGGLIIPLLRRFKSSWLPRRFEMIYPPAILSVTAGVYAAFKLFDHIARHSFDFDPFARPSEVEELYLYLFVLLYLLVMKNRIAAGKP